MNRMSRPNTFERVYAKLKEKLRRGGLRPGERLEPAALSDELNASVTPVRDALHRLTGERLVEAPRHQGFRVPLVTEGTLRQLYGWHLDLLLLALARHSLDPDEIRDENRPQATSTRELLFEGLVRSGSNPEHLHAYLNVTERLDPFHRFETLFLDATEDDTSAILEALHSGDRRTVRARLVRYHRRRQRIVPNLLEHALAS